MSQENNTIQKAQMQEKDFTLYYNTFPFVSILYQIFLDFPFFDIYNDDEFRSEFDSNGKNLHEFYTKNVKS